MLQTIETNKYVVYLKKRVKSLFPPQEDLK